MWIFKQRVVEVPTVAATLEICIFLKTVLFASINSLINIWGQENLLLTNECDEFVLKYLYRNLAELVAAIHIVR